MTHVYRNSRGAVIEWRTSEDDPVGEATVRTPRSQQRLVARGQGRILSSAPPSTVPAPTFQASWARGANTIIGVMP